MKFCQAIIGLLVAALSVMAQTSPRSKVAAAIDSWETRASTRAAIVKIGGDPMPALVAIIESKQDPYVRKWHAILLLPTFKSSGAELGIKEIINVGEPIFRCFALEALVELKSRDAVPILIVKLDDHDTCRQENSSDPARQSDISVSDEAVRLLEHVTGLSFDGEQFGSHRKTEPWKKWWMKQKGAHPAQLLRTKTRIFDAASFVLHSIHSFLAE